MNDNQYKEIFHKQLDKYQEVMKAPIKEEKIYLGMNAIGEYLIVEWNGDFSLLKDMYFEYDFYSKFLLWEGVEIFLANNEDKKVTLIKK